MEKTKISQIEMERFVLRELSADRMAEIERQRDENPSLNKEICAIIESDKEILAQYPPNQIAARIADANRSVESSPKRIISFAVAVSAVATVSVFLTVVFISKNEKIDNRFANNTQSNAWNLSEETRIKGPTEPTLYVYRKGKVGEERLLSGQSATAGDVIQLKFAAKGAQYGVIFSIDGNGITTLHYPGSDSRSAKIDGKGIHTLDFSYELDDAPHFERFFFVTSNNSIEPSEIVEKAKRSKLGIDKSLPLDSSLSQCDFLLKKVRK